MKKTALLVLFAAFACVTGFAQLSKVQGLAKQGLDKEALPIMEGLLQNDSNNAEYLAETSFLIAKVWHDKEVDEKTCAPHYNQALYLAKKAVKLDSNNAQAHYAYAFAVGVLNEYASKKEQIANSKIMKDEIDHCLKLDPHHGGAYHLLGRWSRKLAGFNSFEKFAVKTLFGSALPDATYQDAANAFQKAFIYEPDITIHQYELAYTYYKMGKNADARVWLNQVLNNTTYHGDDMQEVKDKCKALLQKMQ